MFGDLSTMLAGTLGSAPFDFKRPAVLLSVVLLLVCCWSGAWCCWSGVGGSGRGSGGGAAAGGGSARARGSW